MSAFVGDLANVLVVGRCYNQRIMLTLWYRCTIGSGTEGLGTTLNDLMTAVGPAGVSPVFDKYLECLQNDYESAYLQAQIIRPVRTSYRRQVVTLAGMGGPGTVANDSAGITLRSDEAGRGKQGVKHIGPIPDGVSVEGRLTNAYLVKLDDLAEQMLAPFIIPAKATRWEPVLNHRATGTVTKLTTQGLGFTSRVQRRRTVGLGE